MLKRLQIYQKKHNGSCDVPYKYGPDPQLANWVNWQRCQQKKGLLSKERYDQLVAAGFEWTGSNYDEQWNKMFKRVQAYQKKHNGKCDVPKIYRPDPQLGRWVGTQRRYYRKGLLAKERCDQLEAIGFEWTGTHERRNYKDHWTKMLKRLQDYQQEHDGSCEVPSKYPPDQTLSTWVGNQRRKYKRGLLAKERCDQLEKIGFEWTSTPGTYTKLQNSTRGKTKLLRRR